MVSIGIRVKPTVVHFSIVHEENDTFLIKIIDKIIIPNALEIPEQLKFLRGTLLDIINENNVDYGCIRIAESTARTVNIPRTYIEGVIQELIASSSISKYYVGQIAKISAKLGISRDEFKPLAEGREVYNEIENWGSLTLDQRESLLAAFSSFNL